MAAEQCDTVLSVTSGKEVDSTAETAKKYVEALNVKNGEVVWKIPQVGPAAGARCAGTLATAGGLLFYGDPSGDVIAADSRNGRPLWYFPTNGENKTSPVTYTVGGKQFVALAVGPNILSFALP
jgi:outer membrane protein assembly factor BamB